MKRRKILVLAVVVLCWTTAVAAQQQIEEMRHKVVAVSAPKECLVTFREFFRYLQKSEPSIVRDEQAQKRWLTQELRKALTQKVATFTSPQDNPDFPSNNTFIGSWDHRQPIRSFRRDVTASAP